MAVQFGLKLQENALRCEGGGGSSVCSARPCTSAWCAQRLFILSSYLNNKTKPVKAHLHFRRHEETEGYKRALTTSYSHISINNSASYVRREKGPAIESETSSRTGRG